MDEQEYERLHDAVRMLGRKLAQNHEVSHMTSMFLHLHAINCSHTDIPHICVTVDVDDSALLDHEKLKIPKVWEGIPVYICRGKVIFARAGRQESLGENWFDPDSYDHTLKAVLRMANPDCMAGENVDQLAKDLSHEMQFLAPYSVEELQKVFEYINTHKEDLYQYTLEHFRKKAKK